MTQFLSQDQITFMREAASDGFRITTSTQSVIGSTGIYEAQIGHIRLSDCDCITLRPGWGIRSANGVQITDKWADFRRRYEQDGGRLETKDASERRLAMVRVAAFAPDGDLLHAWRQWLERSSFPVHDAFRLLDAAREAEALLRALFGKMRVLDLIAAGKKALTDPDWPVESHQGLAMAVATLEAYTRFSAEKAAAEAFPRKLPASPVHYCGDSGSSGSRTASAYIRNRHSEIRAEIHRLTDHGLYGEPDGPPRTRAEKAKAQRVAELERALADIEDNYAPPGLWPR